MVVAGANVVTMIFYLFIWTVGSFLLAPVVGRMIFPRFRRHILSVQKGAVSGKSADAIRVRIGQFDNGDDQ
jgi:hypothetical protein